MDRGTYDDYPSRRPGDHPDTAKVLKRVEDEIRNEPHEWLIGINARTGKEVFRITDGHPTEVDIGGHPEAYKSFKENQQDIVLTHNHPAGGAPLSDSDVGCLLTQGGREIRACGSHGKTYSMVITDEMRGDPTVRPRLERIGEEMRREIFESIQRRIELEGIENERRIGQEEIDKGLLKAGGIVAHEWRDKGAKYTVIEGGGRSDSLFKDSYPRWDSSLRQLIRY